MEHTTQMIPREQTELLRANIAQAQTIRRLQEELAAREGVIAAMREELRQKDPIVHKFFARHGEGRERARWHEELRADIATAGKVAIVLFGIAYVAQTIFWRLTGLGA